MPSSSDTIAQLASALAKAQSELVNPIKTLTGVIDRWGSGAEGQTYRYAPLSAGLDIVRQTLCKHELAVIQTTQVEPDTAMVMLTTTLAHGSGEWVAARWPVCRTADITNPKLMGAALTYARRYGLFTLVGIAGDDDLDAPEFAAPRHGAGTGVNGSATPRGNGTGATERAQRSSVSVTPSLARAAHGAEHPDVSSPGPQRRRRMPAKARRERAVPTSSGSPGADLLAIDNADALFRWALDVLPARNKLPDHERAELDAAFLARAEALGTDSELLVAFQPASTVAPPAASAA